MVATQTVPDAARQGRKTYFKGVRVMVVHYDAKRRQVGTVRLKKKKEPEKPFGILEALKVENIPLTEFLENSGAKKVAAHPKLAVIALPSLTKRKTVSYLRQIKRCAKEVTPSGDSSIPGLFRKIVFLGRVFEAKDGSFAVPASLAVTEGQVFVYSCQSDGSTVGHSQALESLTFSEFGREYKPTNTGVVSSLVGRFIIRSVQAHRLGD